MRELVLLLSFAAACGKGDAKLDGRPDMRPTTGTAVTLDWTMSRDGDQLQIDYTVSNPTPARIYVLDELPVGDAFAPDAIIVMGDPDAPDTVRLSRALIRTLEKVLTIPMPGARAVEPGATLTGTARAPWPLRAWHNYSTVDPLRGQPAQAVLQIGYVADPGASGFTQRHLPDGTTVTVPTPATVGTQQLLVGDAQPLPK